MINKENYEAYFLDYIEDNLSPKEIDMLIVFLEKNPTLKNELEFYDEISLSPSSSSTFDNNSLKKIDIENDSITNSNFEE